MQDDFREERFRRWHSRRRARRIHDTLPVGLLLLLVGGVLLARQLGVIFPAWLVTWEALIILIGLVVLVRRRFRSLGGLILIAIGAFFLAEDYYPQLRNFIWPAVIIFIGLLLIVRPRCKKKHMFMTDRAENRPPADAPKGPEATPLQGDVLNIASVFGSTSKVVISKNFKGGEIVSVFGGSEINLSQADFAGTAKIEAVAVFGGIKLIVPANWEIRSETAVVIGGIEDKRETNAMVNPEKVVVLEGVVLLGGIEINSY